MHIHWTKTSASPNKSLSPGRAAGRSLSRTGSELALISTNAHQLGKNDRLAHKKLAGGRRCQRWFLPQQSKWPPISTNAHRVGENGRLNSKIFVLVKFTYSDRTVLLPLGLA